jgi:GTP cyclohydrolase I
MLAIDKDAFRTLYITLENLMPIIFKDPSEPGLQRTPERIAGMLRDFAFWWKTEDEPTKALGKVFPISKAEQIIVQTRIPFVGLCEHHLLPMVGHTSIGYLPHEYVVGLSKLTRLVRAAGYQRPSLQETITDLIADTLYEHKELTPRGVIVVVHAMHTCMAIRGVLAPNVWTTTSAVRGVFRESASAKAEFFSLVGLNDH